MFERMEQHPRANISEFISVIRSDLVALVTGFFSLPLTVGSLVTTGYARALFAVGAAGAFLVAAYRAWSGERNKRVELESKLAPRLGFEFDPQDDRFVCETSLLDHTEIVYIRVLARPQSPVVKNCRAYLKSVSQLAEGGDKYDSIFEDHIPLPWSYGNPNDVQPKELNQSVDSFLDVAWVVERDFGLLNKNSNIPNQLRDVLRFLIIPEPSRNLKLDVLLIGDDSEPATLSLNIHRGNPQWNKPQVGWMTDQSGNAIHILRSNVSTDLTPFANLV